MSKHDEVIEMRLEMFLDAFSELEKIYGKGYKGDKIVEFQKKNDIWTIGVRD